MTANTCLGPLCPGWPYVKTTMGSTFKSWWPIGPRQHSAFNGWRGAWCRDWRADARLDWLTSRPLAPQAPNE
jgi:hypothetical protein